MKATRFKTKRKIVKILHFIGDIMGFFSIIFILPAFILWQIWLLSMSITIMIKNGFMIDVMNATDYIEKKYKDGIDNTWKIGVVVSLCIWVTIAYNIFW